MVGGRKERVRKLADRLGQESGGRRQRVSGLGRGLEKCVEWGNWVAIKLSKVVSGLMKFVSGCGAMGSGD